ncbi:o-succinylbenzoate--CoA ligase [Shewanella dokdonensis]|uniref:O-succinylbenzoate--CoA ligase n=1 Tax=Shewanella dokdonensis TaxID=712036 RepID=A0ABX8DIT5_9GAMM|nr:o-succinylbenzoate--CoA ligase [Shewanella dokdonensis]MCL1075686.1 o-succinylbenzoate--CoA ligase [Shewanella dokdonensis]QVK24677.1 o-succinylbenzoate--CoA ligase [Shewanella dokdonensis]
MLSPLHQSARQHPAAIALMVNGRGLSYRNLSQQVLALGIQLREAGLQPGDKLACIAGNGAELVKLYWACIDNGLLFCPLSPKFPDSQLTGLLQRFAIQYLWCPDDARQSLWQQCHRLVLNFSLSATHAAPDIIAEHPVDIILTSGSSGTPKAAMHSLAGHLANAEGSRSLIALQTDDGWLASLPLFHVGGLAIINRCALAAATVVLPDSNLTLSQQLKRDPISHLSLVATQLQQLLDDAPTSLLLIKYLLLGGSAISQSLLDRLQPLDMQVFTSYGMTEMGSQITTGPVRTDGSSGKLLPGRELQIRDNIIWLRGATLFLGYLQDDGRVDKATDEAGWFCSKDRGFWDEQGRLHIQGRADNMFICGGENIQPEEVEAALKLHPDILEALVFPEPDGKFGYLPSAVVKTRSGQLPDAAEIKAFLSQHMASFKRPRRYYVWPATEQAGLKVQRQQIIAQVAGTDPH